MFDGHMDKPNSTTPNRRRTQKNHGILSKIKPFLFNFQNLFVGFSFPFSSDFENNHVMNSKWNLEDARNQFYDDYNYANEMSEKYQGLYL